MDIQSKRQLVEGWVARYKNYREQGADDSFFWAFEKLDDICRTDPKLGLDLVLQILATNSSDPVAENLAAGPLEDLLSKHGDQIIELVEENAKTSPTFRQLLGGVWQNTMSNELWERVQKISVEKW